MLVVTRKKDEKLIIGNEIEIQVLRIGRDNVRLGIKAPSHISIYRYEIYEAIKQENVSAVQSQIPDKDTLETLKGVRGPFDLAFIDADKENYGACYEAALEMLRPGRAIVVDNCLWSGRVLNPQDEEDRAIATLNQRIVSDGRVENVLLPIRDGVNLVVKL